MLWQALLVDGVLNISREYAQGVFFDRHYLKQNRYWTEQERTKWERAASKCAVLLELNKQSALPFYLHEVVEDVSASGEEKEIRRSRRFMHSVG